MKTKFTKEYITENKGCYEIEDVERIPFDENREITLKQLFEYLPIKDFCWWVAKKCELTIRQNQFFALNSADFALQFYEKQYPNDMSIRNLNKASRDYLNGKIKKAELLEFRRIAASSAYAYAYASDSYAAYASAASASDSYAASASSAYASSAYASDSDSASDSAKFKESVKAYVFTEIKTIK